MSYNEAPDQRSDDCSTGRSARINVAELLEAAGELKRGERVVCAEVEDGTLTAAIAEVPDR